MQLINFVATLEAEYRIWNFKRKLKKDHSQTSLLVLVRTKIFIKLDLKKIKSSISLLGEVKLCSKLAETLQKYHLKVVAYQQHKVASRDQGARNEISNKCRQTLI